MTDIEEQIEFLCNNKRDFDKLIYTPVEEAVNELKLRQANNALEDYTRRILGDDIPEIIKCRKSMVLFRHVATLNYEIRRFLIGADALSDDLKPIIFEYLSDSFNNRNAWKFSLGKISLHKGLDKNKKQIFECKNIIDMNSSNNKPLHSVVTHWKQPLVDFHHEIFSRGFPHLKDNVFDLSTWLHKFGDNPKDFYKPFFTLFLKHGILFENYLFNKEEALFTKTVILPIILEISKESGVKPLIVALEPTEIEDDPFWMSHPHHEKEFIESRMKNI